MTVSLRKNHPIDLNCQYPCPCRRKGILLPIILTEAMGCDRCQQIFVVTEEKEGYIEQLNPSYPYQKKWRWSGKRWISRQKPWQKNSLFVGVIYFFLAIFASIPGLIALKIGINLISGIIIGSILILLFSSFWFDFRR